MAKGVLGSEGGKCHAGSFLYLQVIGGGEGWVLTARWLNSPRKFTAKKVGSNVAKSLKDAKLESSFSLYSTFKKLFKDLATNIYF